MAASSAELGQKIPSVDIPKRIGRRWLVLGAAAGVGGLAVAAVASQAEQFFERSPDRSKPFELTTELGHIKVTPDKEPGTALVEYTLAAGALKDIRRPLSVEWTAYAAKVNLGVESAPNHNYWVLTGSVQPADGKKPGEKYETRIMSPNANQEHLLSAAYCKYDWCQLSFDKVPLNIERPK